MFDNILRTRHARLGRSRFRGEFDCQRHIREAQDLHTRLFTRLGFRGLDAEIRARLTLCYLSWEPSMYPHEPGTRRFKLVKALTELLTKK